MYDWQQRLEVFAARDSAKAKNFSYDHVLASHRRPGGERFKLLNDRMVQVVKNGNLLVVWDGEGNNFVDIYESIPRVRHRMTIRLDWINWWNVAVYNELILLGTREKELLLWDSQSNIMLDRCELESEPISVAIGGRCIVVGLHNGSIQLVELQLGTDRLIKGSKLENAHKGAVIVAAYGNVFAASMLNRVLVWNSELRKCVALLPINPERKWCHLISINDKVLVVSRSNEVRVYDREREYKLRFVIQLPNAEICCLSLLHGEKALVAIESTATIALLCLSSGDILQSFKTPVGSSIEVTADARLVITSYKPCYGLFILDPPRNGILARALENHARVHFGKHFIQRCTNNDKHKLLNKLRVLGVATVGAAAITLLRNLHHRNS